MHLLTVGLSRFRAKNTKVVRLGLKWWGVLALAVLCGLLSGARSAASPLPQQASSPAASETSDKPTVPATPTPAQDQSAPKPAPHKSSPTKSATAPGTHPPAKKTAPAARATAKRHRPISPRVRRIREAFVASTTLRPMAQQLILDRSPAGYAGVEAYARAHSKEDAGALAWLVVGYAHVLDHDYAKAIDPLNRAKPLAGDLGDYVAYYLGTCYLQTGHQAEGLAALANFHTTYPDSLLVRDAHLSYATALLTEGRAAEAAELLEKDRLPARSDYRVCSGPGLCRARPDSESRRGARKRLLQHADCGRSRRGVCRVENSFQVPRSPRRRNSKLAPTC